MFKIKKFFVLKNNKITENNNCTNLGRGLSSGRRRLARSLYGDVSLAL